MDRTDTMPRARILRWASLSAALAACAAALAAVSLTGWSLFQPDTRYMVAIGRWIIETGELPTSDPLTLHEGLAYICQQWPLCIATAAIFDAFGEAGIKCAAAALDIHPRGRYRPALAGCLRLRPRFHQRDHRGRRGRIFRPCRCGR